ncbi:hypothetical protein ABZS96_44965, partial [Streptomyces avermitilis]
MTHEGDYVVPDREGAGAVAAVVCDVGGVIIRFDTGVAQQIEETPATSGATTPSEALSSPTTRPWVPPFRPTDRQWPFPRTDDPSVPGGSPAEGLGARRAHQQRRRHKRRIPMPDENTASADLEQEMRNNASADGLDLLHQALRALAANCARTGGLCPRSKRPGSMPVDSKFTSRHRPRPSPPSP